MTDSVLEDVQFLAFLLQVQLVKLEQLQTLFFVVVEAVAIAIITSDNYKRVYLNNT